MEGLKLDKAAVVEKLNAGSSSKFLGVQETVRQEKKVALLCAAKTYLQRMSVIWSSFLLDINCVKATNQFTVPVLTYLIWKQHWTVTELRGLNRKAERLYVRMVENIH